MNESELLAYCAHHNARLARIFAGETPEQPFFVRGIAYGRLDQHMTYTDENLSAWIENASAYLRAEMAALKPDRTFRPLVFDLWFYGVHFIDKLFGAEVTYAHDQWWTEEVGWEVGALEPVDPASSELVRRVMAFTDQLVEASDGLIYVCAQVLASPLNIAVNLYGQRFLLMLAERPEAARHDIRTITDLTIALHKLTMQHVPPELLRVSVGLERFMPDGYGLIDGCTTQLVSPGMYRDFLAGSDNAILETYPNGGMIHLCGASAQHIPAFREMPALKAVQLNDRATDDFARYYKELRPDQIVYVVPNERVTVPDILEISGGGRRVVIQAEA